MGKLPSKSQMKKMEEEQKESQQETDTEVEANETEPKKHSTEKPAKKIMKAIGESLTNPVKRKTKVSKSLKVK